MSNNRWIPDSDSKSPQQGQPSAPMPYVSVPPLTVSANDRLNTAGWSTPVSEGIFVCRTCNKQLRAQFSGLMLFPLFKANIDLFQFTYMMPQHKSGGPFSKEVCAESGTIMTRDFERPTYVKFLDRDQTPTNGPPKEPTLVTATAPGESSEDPTVILKTRLARGEITEKEFERLTKIVGGGVRSAPKATQEEADSKKLEEEVRKKLDGLSPQMAEERYNYLNGRPISELTDAEYEERLALAQRLSEKHTGAPKKKSQ